MKFGPLIEHNRRDNFLEKSYTMCGGDTIPRPLSKLSKLSISLDQYSKVFHSLFLWHQKNFQITLKLSCKPLAFTSYQVFFQKKAWNQSHCLIFYMIFGENFFSCHILLPDTIFSVWLPLLREILHNMYNVTVC